LRQVVQHLKIAVDNEEKAKKAELKCAVLDHFVEETYFQMRTSVVWVMK